MADELIQVIFLAIGVGIPSLAIVMATHVYVSGKVRLQELAVERAAIYAGRDRAEINARNFALGQGTDDGGDWMEGLMKTIGPFLAQHPEVLQAFLKGGGQQPPLGGVPS